MEKVQGREHPDVAARLDNLASLYLDQGKYAEVEPLLQRSLAIVEKALGPYYRKLGLTFKMVTRGLGSRRPI